MLALLLATIVLLVGVPLVIANLSTDQRPALTLDICHPAQSVAVASAHCSLPISSPTAGLESFDLSSRLFWPAALLNPRSPDQPEAPPPKIALSSGI